MFTLTLDPTTVNQIAGILAEKPFKDVAHIIMNLQQQVTVQEAQQRTAAEETAKQAKADAEELAKLRAAAAVPASETAEVG